MAKVLDELYTLLGFKIDDKDLLKFQLKLVGVIATITKFTADTLKAVVELDNFNKMTGISAELLNQWQLIAQRNNVSAGAIINAFETIARARGDLLAGKSISNAWALLGINPNDNPEKVFKNVLNSLKSIQDVNLKSTRLSDLGFDPQLINLIDGKGIELFKGRVLTEPQRKEILQLKQSFTDIKITLSLWKDKIVFLMSPLKYVVNSFRRIADTIDLLIEKTIGWQNLVKTFVLWFSLIFAKMFPIATIITAIALTIEDIITYIQGGDSIFGGFVGKIKNFIEDLKTVYNFFASLLPEAVKEFFTTYYNLAKKVIEAITKPFLFIIEKMNSLLGKMLPKSLKESIKEFTEPEENNKEEVKQKLDTKPKIQAVNELFNFGMKPDNKINNNMSTINNNPTITNTFNINGAKSPQAVGNEIAGLQQQINNSSLIMESL